MTNTIVSRGPAISRRKEEVQNRVKQYMHKHKNQKIPEFRIRPAEQTVEKYCKYIRTKEKSKIFSGRSKKTRHGKNSEKR